MTQSAAGENTQRVQRVSDGAAPPVALAKRVRKLERRLRLVSSADSVPLLQDARRLARIAGRVAADEDLRCRVQLMLGQSALQAGSFREAAWALERALKLGADTVDTRLDLAYAYSLSGRPDRTVEFLQSSLAATDTVQGRTRLSIVLSFALTDIGDLRGAHEALETARVALLSSDVDLWLRARFSAAEARLADAAGMHLLALIRIGNAIWEIERASEPLWAAKLHVLAGEYALFAGRRSTAAHHLSTAVQLMAGVGDAGDRMLLEMLLGFLSVENGRAEEAELAARSVLARIGDEDPAEQGRARWLLARALAAQGRLAEAATEFATSDRLALRAMRYTVRIRRDWADVLQKLGREDEARSLRVRAAAVERIRRLPETEDLLLRELEARQSAQLTALAALEARVVAAERVLGVPRPTRQGQLRPVS